jgi:hypothetical protein
MLQQSTLAAHKAWQTQHRHIRTSTKTAALGRRELLGKHFTALPNCCLLPQHVTCLFALMRMSMISAGQLDSVCLPNSCCCLLHAAGSGLCCCSSLSCTHRSQWFDKYFAYNMAVGMTEYEAAMRPVKQVLFKQLFMSRQQQAGGSSGSSGGPVSVLEVGIGAGGQLAVTSATISNMQAPILPRLSATSRRRQQQAHSPTCASQPNHAAAGMVFFCMPAQSLWQPDQSNWGPG